MGREKIILDWYTCRWHIINTRCYCYVVFLSFICN